MEDMYRKGVVAFVLDYQDNILIVQLNDYKENEWALPGGGIEKGETAEEAVYRELNEELSIHHNDIEIRLKATEPIVYDFSKEYLEKSKSSVAKNYVGQSKTAFLVEFKGEKNKLKKQEEEIRKYKWVPIIDLESYFRFPNQLNTVNQHLSDFDVK